MDEKKEVTLNDFRVLLAENKLGQLINQLTIYTEELGNSNLYNRVLIQAAKYKQNSKNQHLGNVDYNDLMRSRTNILLALLNIINELPDNKEKEKLNTKWGVSESRIKKIIFKFLLFGKIGLILYSYYLWRTGSGFTFEGFIGVIAVLTPVFATYIGIVIEDILKNRYPHKSTHFRVNKRVLSLTYFAFLAYYFFMFMALYLHGTGFIPDYGIINDEGKPDYKILLGIIAAIESGFGGYIGIIVTTIFKKDIEKP